MNMNEVWEVAQEVAEKTGKKAETIVFTDGSMVKVTGSWTANKPVWAIFQGVYKPEEVAASLMQAHEDADGVPCWPAGVAVFKREHPEIWEQINNTLNFI